MSKHPGTSGLMPVKGSTCGIRPDLDAMDADTGFDFSQAKQLLQEQSNIDQSQKQTNAEPDPAPAKNPQHDVKTPR